MSVQINDLNIKLSHPLIAPVILNEDLPLTESHADSVARGRDTVRDILHGRDDRLMVIVGPCSIHDPAAAMDYAHQLQEQVQDFNDVLYPVLRVYFEKPRTTVGWKGLINDPDLDQSFHINKGLHMARKLLLDVAHLGLPAATEFLDTIFGQFYADLISFGAIGARTVESQVHRELASGLSMSVGFKNRTDGDIQIAVDAMYSAANGHSFPSLTKEGTPAILETKGNRDACVILRGGSQSGPNYQQAAVTETTARIEKSGLTKAIVIDCSHGNSGKKPENQPLVAESVVSQKIQGNEAIKGIMLESHLVAGNQSVTEPQSMVYGQSITDACMSLQSTVELLDKLANRLVSRQSTAN